MAQMTLEEIRQFWTSQAVREGQSHAASWGDRPVIELEINEIARHLRDGQRVIDIGCANGFSTVQYAAQRKISIKGVDYVPEMVSSATERLTKLPAQLSGSVEFAAGDITDLHGESDNSYDSAIVTRVIINLPDAGMQARGLAECARIVRPGGLLLLSEATVEGWERLNTFRQEWNLPPIQQPPFNTYVRQPMLVEALSHSMVLEAVIDFSSTYYVATRVIKPIFAKLLGGNIDIANTNMEFNRFSSLLPPHGDYGVQKLFVFRKRSCPPPQGR